MADIIFNSLSEYVGDGTIDFDTNPFYCALLSDSYSIDATDTTFAEVSGSEVSEVGYIAGGKAMTSVTWNRNGGTTIFDADNTQWTGATFTTRYGVVYQYGTFNSIANALVCLVDFATNQIVSNGTFTVQWNAIGIVGLETPTP
jgi:hypothetical protein